MTISKEAVEAVARAIYLDKYAEIGGKWEAVETREPWSKLAKAAITALLATGEVVVKIKREYPSLLSEQEKKDLLKRAEDLWEALQENKLGGFSGINRPFFILNEFKDVIEQFGGRDVGLTWSYNDLQKANGTTPAQKEGV